VYDDTFDEIYTTSVLRAEEKSTRFQVSQLLRESYTPWIPSEQEVSALEDAMAVPCQGRVYQLFNLLIQYHMKSQVEEGC